MFNETPIFGFAERFKRSHSLHALAHSLTHNSLQRTSLTTHSQRTLTTHSLTHSQLHPLTKTVAKTLAKTLAKTRSLAHAKTHKTHSHLPAKPHETNTRSLTQNFTHPLQTPLTHTHRRTKTHEDSLTKTRSRTKTCPRRRANTRPLNRTFRRLTHEDSRALSSKQLTRRGTGRRRPVAVSVLSLFSLLSSLWRFVRCGGNFFSFDRWVSVNFGRRLHTCITRNPLGHLSFCLVPFLWRINSKSRSQWQKNRTK